MSLPEFTAEASLYSSINHYSAIAIRLSDRVSVQPQYTLPPWTPCRWLLFCCTEFRDQSCCDNWYLQCIPE
jgi:hypothetical protein